MVVKLLGLGFEFCLYYCVALGKFLNFSEPFFPIICKMEMLVYNLFFVSYQIHGILLKIQQDNEHKAVSKLLGTE